MSVSSYQSQWVQYADRLSDHYSHHQHSSCLGRLQGGGVVLLKGVSAPFVHLLDVLDSIARLFCYALAAPLYRGHRARLIPQLRRTAEHMTALFFVIPKSVLQIIKGGVGVMIDPKAKRSFEKDATFSCRLQKKPPRMPAVQEHVASQNSATLHLRGKRSPKDFRILWRVRVPGKARNPNRIGGFRYVPSAILKHRFY